MAENANLDGILGTIYSNYANSISTARTERTVAYSLGSQEYANFVSKSEHDIKSKKSDEKSMLDNLASVYKNHNKLVNQHEIKLAEQRIKNAKEIYSLNKNNLEEYTKLSNNLADVYENISKNDKATLGDLAKIYTLKKQQAELEKNTIEYKTAQFNKGVENVKQAWSTIITHIVDGFNKYWDLMYWDNLKKGISDLNSQYEQRYTEIAARSGSDTKLDAHNIIKSTANTIVNDSTLKSSLNFNNEVFPAITDAVQQGFMGQEAQDIAISNAIDKKITPWLETSSETWVQLQYNLSDTMITQIKGQQLLLQETREGNRILQTGVVSQITDALVPTLQSIDANGSNKETMGAAYEYVEQLMAGGMSKSDAVSYVKKLIRADQDTFGALTSSDYSQILMGIGAMNGGGIVGAQNMINTSVGAMISNTSEFDEIGRSAIAHGFNLQLPSDDAYYKDIYKLEYTGKYDNKDTETVYNSTLNNLEKYVTATQLQDNSIQNAQATDMMDWTLTAHGLDVQETILDEVINIKNWLIKTLVTLPLIALGNKAIDGLIGKLGGSSGTSVGLMSKLLTGGDGFSMASALGSGQAGSVALGEGLKTSGLIGGLAQGGAGLTGGAASGGLAAGIGVAGLAGGAFMIGKGVEYGIDTIKNWDDSSTADKGVGIGASLGAAAGGTMLGAAALGLASGLVGWAGLAIGALAIGVKSVYDYNKKMKEACTDVDILGSEFANLKDQVKQNTKAKHQELESIREQFYLLGDETEQRKLLINNGIIPNTDKTKLSTEMLEKYIEKMDIVVSDSGEKQEEVLGGLEAKYSAKSKDEIKSVIDQVYGNIKGKDEQTQRALLKQLGYTEEEINAGMKNAANGAMSDGELWRFLTVNDVKMKGVEIGSLEEKLESGEISENTLNRYMGKNTNSTSRITTKDEWMTGLSEIVEAVDYLSRYQKYGRADNPIDATGPDAVGFNIDTYNQYKNYLLGLGKGNKQKVADVWSEYGLDSSALVDFPNSIKGYKLGSSYIAYEQLALLHAGERVLTAGQNKEYTQELMSGNSASSIIQAGVQDIVMAIKTQTHEIINYLSTMSFNNSSFGNSHVNMLPTMGNTKVTI